MKVEELEELARMRKFATQLLTGKSPKIELEVAGQTIACTGQRAQDIGAGIMLCVRSLEHVSGLPTPTPDKKVIH